MTDSEKNISPLAAFSKTILEEMKKRMTDAEFADLLKECQEVKNK